MKEKLLSYLLDDLCPVERAEIEAALAEDPTLREELAKLQECMGPCEEAESDSVPPTQLAKRTCCFVDHAIQKSQAVCHSAASATKRLSENRDHLNPNRRWTMADFIGTVCVCAALGGLIVPALRDGRDMARRTTCVNNLHNLTAASMDYSLFKKQGLPTINSNEHAGLFVGKIVGSGYLSPEEASSFVICPDSELAERISDGCITVRISTPAQYQAAKGAKRHQIGKYMGGSYAYSIGYVDKTTGQLNQVDFHGNRNIPLIADAPSREIAGYQSANHGGCGQNVAFQDLSVRYCTQCKCDQKKDHWYLNDEGKPAAGLHPKDIVLAPSEMVPFIKITFFSKQQSKTEP